MNRTARIAIAGLAVAAVAAPAAAQTHYGQPAYSSGYGQPAYSQDYGQAAYGQSQAYYDQCVRDQRQRQVAGGLLGAALGVAAGRSVASRRVRSEGGLLGAAVGALAGASVGRSTAACDSQNARYGYDYDYGRQPGYPQDYGYGRDPYGYDQGYGRDYGYGYDRADPYANSSGCRLSESRVRLPDGREDVRHVRVCPDSSGRYRIVD